MDPFIPRKVRTGFSRSDNVIASDIKQSHLEVINSETFEIIDAQDYSAIKTCVEKITHYL